MRAARRHSGTNSARRIVLLKSSAAWVHCVGVSRLTTQPWPGAVNLWVAASRLDGRCVVHRGVLVLPLVAPHVAGGNAWPSDWAQAGGRSPSSSATWSFLACATPSRPTQAARPGRTAVLRWPAIASSMRPCSVASQGIYAGQPRRTIGGCWAAWRSPLRPPRPARTGVQIDQPGLQLARTSPLIFADRASPASSIDGQRAGVNGRIFLNHGDLLADLVGRGGRGIRQAQQREWPPVAQSTKSGDDVVHRRHSLRDRGRRGFQF